VLFEMLAGAPPFTGPDGHVLLAKRFTDSPPSLRAVRDDVAPVLDTAVARALAREPADRFANALDLAHAIWDDSHSALHATAREPQRRRVRRPRVWIMSGGLAIAAVLGGSLLIRDRPEPPPTAVRSATVPPVTRDSVRPPTPRTPGVASPSLAAPRSTVETPHPPAKPPIATHQTTRTARPVRDTVLAALRLEALRARTRAVDAGVAVSELTLGDSLLRVADTSAAAGRRSNAVVAMSNATASWLAAIRQQARATIDSQPARRDSQPVARVAAESVRAAARRPATDSVAARAGAVAPTKNAPDARAEIRVLFDSYSHAIESRSVPAIAQLYPTMSDAQQRDWAQFFNTVRDVKVRLTLTQLDVTGTSADARVDGTYEYTNTSTHRTEQRPVTFRASLGHDATGWRLRAIQ